MMKFILSVASPMRNLQSYDRYLFVGPHPDDIEIGAGATAAKLVAKGKTVAFVIALDGRYGFENAPKGITPEALIEIRKKEALASAAALGVTDVTFLGLSDGAQYEMKDLHHALAKAIGDFGPDVVFAPDPNLISECHQDHLNVGEAVRQLAFFAPFADIMQQYDAKPAQVVALAYYYTAHPNTYVRTSGFVAQQLAAIFDHHLSQFPEHSVAAQSVAQYLKLRSFFLGLRRLGLHAEGFRMLDRTRMHVVSEAGR
ncbi:MAG: PIG-L deacetylase family protein [Sphaerochaeta associata]|uniref:PIG-L deacetylase family protein n=1 Tax=Sphaerochaeta associata TaxID=1129264 RepID=UPI002B202F1E|nr:PIG-L deacetylase family protein [Sphaerochaeta associata]MEA5106528.1 PIG-L deacetylase family protein [Sphaerochaeta associata]